MSEVVVQYLEIAWSDVAVITGPYLVHERSVRFCNFPPHTQRILRIQLVLVIVS